MTTCVICNSEFNSDYSTEYCDECYSIYEDDTPSPIGEKCYGCKNNEATSKVGDHSLCDDCRDYLVRVRESILKS